MSDTSATGGLPQDVDLASALLTLSPAFTRFVLAELRASDLGPRITPPQLRALEIVANAPGITMSAFADALGVRLPTASVLAMRLDAAGLVERVRGARRSVALKLTAKGQAQFNALAFGLVERLSRGLQSLSADDRTLLRAAVPKIAEALARAANA